MTKSSTLITSPAVLPAALSDAALRKAAGPGAFGRGMDYAKSDHVQLTRQSDDAVTALVMGSWEYQVKLAFGTQPNEQGMEYDCSCPVGDDGEFCKHAVATALIWRERWMGQAATAEVAPTSAKGKPAPQKRAKPAARGAAAIRKSVLEFLAQQPSKTLAQYLLKMADGDHDLMKRLTLWMHVAPNFAAPKKRRSRST